MTQLYIMVNPFEQCSSAFLTAIKSMADQTDEDIREAFIRSIYREGGKGFLRRVQAYGTTERGSKLIMDPWFAEYVELVGDLRLAHVLVTGPSQCGKTIVSTLLACDVLSFGKLNIGWFYSIEKARNMNMPTQFKPCAKFWKQETQAQGHNFARKGDLDDVSRYQIGGATGFFSYASTSAAKAGKDSAAVGGVAASFTADVLFLEERSQYPPGAAGPLPRRLDASKIPTKPIRELGTPGGGGGIESGFGTSLRHFYPHYTCPSCGAIKPLDPKGVLLRPYNHPKRGQQYLSESGKPLNWFHRDENDPIRTAYFACSKCGNELHEEVRYNAHMRCLKTGISAREFLDALPTDQKDPKSTRKHKIIVHLSPVCRRSTYNEAEDIVQTGLDSEDSTDWQQQRLGHVSERSSNQLTHEVIKSAIDAPTLGRTANCRLAGIDQGRGQYWMWIASYTCMDPNWKSMATEVTIERTIRTVLWAGPIMKNEIFNKLHEYSVEFGLIDNEPERTEAAELQRITCLQMADQRAGLRDSIQKSQVMEGGTSTPCWLIRNEKFLKQVLTSFMLTWTDGFPLIRLPEEWNKWMKNNSELSPVRHLTGPSYDRDSGKWKRGPGNIDDLYYSAMFCEAAFYMWLSTDLSHKKKTLLPGSLGVVRKQKRGRSPFR